MEKEVIITPAQIRGARALLDWSQNRLAKATGMSLTTIRDYEKERRGWREDDKEDAGQAVGGLAAIRHTLENEGVMFLPSEGNFGPGVRIIAKIPNVLRWPTRLGRWEPLLVPVEWRGHKVNVFVSHEVLDDLGRFRNTQPAAEYLRIYEEHRADILQAAAAAIDAGRVTPDGRVHLGHSDFSQFCERSTSSTSG
jgi:transcriptional regulator with XRE-family HTH domain